MLISGTTPAHRVVLELTRTNSDRLWDSLQSSLLERLNDKVPLVRAEAAHALERLQDLESDACPVTTELVRAMQTDSSKYVCNSGFHRETITARAETFANLHF